MPSLRAPRNPRQRQRSRLSSAFNPVFPEVTWTATVAGNVVTMTTNLPLVVDDTEIPNITVQGVLPAQSAVITSPTSFELTYTAAVSTNTIVVPANVNMIRGAMGGPLAAGSLVLP